MQFLKHQHLLLRSGEVLIYAERAEDQSAAKAILLESKELELVNLGQLVFHLNPDWKELEPLRFKLIGSRGDLKKLGKILHGSRHTIETQILFDEKYGNEVVFIPQERRLRVKKKEIGTAEKKKTKILIVDDSKVIRQLLMKIFEQDPSLKVVGAVEKPSEAMKLIAEAQPDVITLDIHLPEQDGVSFMKAYLPKYPIPTIMISSDNIEAGSLVLDALEMGAVDYIQKPDLSEISEVSLLMIEKVKNAAQIKVIAPSLKRENRHAKVIQSTELSRHLIAIGSSTGGTEALRKILTLLPEKIPPIVIVQHIPAVFSLAFAKRLNELCPFEVKEAADGDQVKENRVLIAPGGLQMRLLRRGSELIVRIEDSAPVNRHKPSVDVLFESIHSLKLKRQVIAAILTGMGSDGAQGLYKLKQAGARTLAQDEKSCVVFGMPKEAIRLGAAEKVLSLLDIPDALVDWISSQKKVA